MDSHNFFDLFMPQNQSLDIKEEGSDQTFSLISPPITPPPPPPSYTLPCLPSTSRRRGSTSSLAASKRTRPYPLLNRKDDIGSTMSSSAYGTWSASGRNGHGRSHPVERRSSDDDPAYTIPQQYMNESYLGGMSDGSSDMRPISSSSSLTGAMGDANLTSRQSRSPASSHSGHMYTGNVQNHDLATWNTTPHMQANMTIAMNNSAYPGVAGGMSFPNMVNNIDMSSLNEYSTRNVSPESLSPHSPHHYPQTYGSDSYPNQGPSRGQMSQHGQGFSGQQMAYHPSGSMSSPEGRKDDEVQRLRRRVQELEREVKHAKSSVEMRNSANGTTGLPTPPHSAAFQSSWRARTEARKRVYCSLNRAGNALCAWHDSRRERRAYPPRNAPPGFLNCGCTYEEALFEESLSRHGVGSYLPGETVRMDPALRNPLLKLLQERYGYKDGDFEHDPITETWAEGESPLIWEKKAQSGIAVKRRTDADRH